MTPPPDVLNAFVLLDRSGSMSTRWDEALGAINAYVHELGDAAVVTLATFDAVDSLKFEVIRDRTPAAAWKDVKPVEASPRGYTPLLDALSRIIALAEAAAGEKTVIVVMTDGQENASREITKESARAAVERCQAKHWQVIFLGADFDAFAEAGGVGVGVHQTIKSRGGSYGLTMRSVARYSREYRDTGKGVAFTDEDRKEADE